MCERFNVSSFVFQLVASGLQNDAMKDKIGGLLHYENQQLTRVLNKNIGGTMTSQISTETWSVLCNALMMDWHCKPYSIHLFLATKYMVICTCYWKSS